MFTPPAAIPPSPMITQTFVYRLKAISWDDATPDQKQAWIDVFPVGNMMSDEEFRSIQDIHDRVRNYLGSKREPVPGDVKIQDMLNRLVGVGLAESKIEGWVV